MELPIACTLTEAERPARLAEMCELSSRGLIDAKRDGSRAVLRFRPEQEIRARVDAFVDAESRCCAFLAFDVADEDGATVLTISTPQGGEEVLDEIVVAFKEPA